MSKIIKFPPASNCPACGDKLRPATRQEIREGLTSTNPVIRQAFAHAVQGDMGKKFLVENSFTERLEDDTPPGSWLLICNSCGLKSVHSVEEPEE